jgi:hypothetical protein
LGLNYSVATVPSFSFVPGFLNIGDAFFAYDLNPDPLAGEGGAGNISYTRIGKPIPESTSVIALLGIGTLGIGAIFKRKE